MKLQTIIKLAILTMFGFLNYQTITRVQGRSNHESIYQQQEDNLPGFKPLPQIIAEMLPDTIEVTLVIPRYDKNTLEFKHSEMNVPKADYLRRRNKPRTSNSQHPGELEKYIESKNPSIVELSRLITSGSKSEAEKIARILSYVPQNINYTADPGYGYTQTGIETILEKTGDCEDLTVLTSSLLNAQGIPSKIATFMPQPNNHTAIAVPYSKELESYLKSFITFSSYTTVRYINEEGEMQAMLDNNLKHWTFEDVFDDMDRKGYFEKHMTAMIGGEKYLLLESTANGWSDPHNFIGWFGRDLNSNAVLVGEK